MYSIKDRKSNTAKTVIIIVLAVVIVFESCLCAFFGLRSKGTGTQIPQFSLNLDASALSGQITDAVSETASGLIDDIKNNTPLDSTIMGTVQKIVYSDAIVSTVMSLSYPLLYNTLTSLELMDFAENVSTSPTGTMLAEKLAGKSYTAVDKDGTRKALSDVLKNVGENWSYMDTTVTWTQADGTSATTNIWNSINWGVTGMDTFYTAMGDMSEGIRGILEVTMQHKEKIVNINPVDYLLHYDKINVRMDAATIFADTAASGYSLCIIPLFNMLGLVPGEYESDDVFCAHDKLSDLWKAVLEPVLLAVNKASQDPAVRLPDMLVNFVHSVESGELAASMKTLRLDGDYAELASLAMGYEDGLIFNLGDALIQIIESMGIRLTGSFNDLLDSLLRMIMKNPSADLPQMDTARLFEGATTEKLSNGVTVYHADADKVIDYLVEYIIHENTVSVILDQTSLKGTQTATDICNAVSQSKDGLKALVNIVVDFALAKLNSGT